MAQIVLDTNFLLIPVQFKVDIYKELKGNDLVILDSCLKELERLSTIKAKAAMEIALSRIKNRNLKIVKTRSASADRDIAAYAKEFNCIVATNDKELIKILKKSSIKIIRLRQKKYLVEE